MRARGVRALAVCIALSIGLHLLALVGGPRESGTAPPPPTAAQAPRALQVRLIAARQAPPPSSLDASGVAFATPGSPKKAVPSNHDVPQRQTAEAAPLAASARDSSPAPGPATPSDVEVAGRSEFEDYLPRRMLTKPPTALAPIDIPAPSERSPLGRRVGTLQLFIDDEGRVRQVVADDLVLPPQLEQLARDAFMAGRFSPGEVDGHPAKSRIRVEVAFD